MSGKKEHRPSQDLTALEDSYRIVGELSARDHVRAYLANRTADGSDVLILVTAAPPGDTGNALTLFAADANLLSGLEHRSLIPIHEGRWVGENSFAVVTDRCTAPTLETLVTRGDPWSYPRIATILHEVNGLLEWARQQKVVHRRLTLDTVHLEATTDRVLASFVAQPLTRHGAPGAEGDARTIAELAWSLITRGRELPHTAEDSLGVVRPELPRRLVEATDALLHGQRIGDTEPPAVLDYIALVAMTDAVMKGEVDAAETEATIYQEQLLEREAWAAKEHDYLERMSEQDRNIAAEREAMAATLAQERQQLADEKAELEARVAAERAELERQVADERATMEQTLVEERASMERTIADERAAMERTLAEATERMAAERADLEQAVASEREELTRLRLEMERSIAEEREQLSQERAAHDAELAAERAAMASTIATERADLEQRILDERTRLEATLSEEQQRMLEERTAAESALAQARAEFEERMRVQREELEAQLAREREEFDQAIIAERNALEAEKEGLAVYNAAEREAIEAERRALEELYLAYESEGHVVEEVHEHERVVEGSDRGLHMPAALADIAPLAVAAPVTEPAADPAEPAETESGLTRKDAKRSKRAAWGIPLSVLLLVGAVTATALGVRSGDDDAAERVQDRPVPTATRAAAPIRSAPTVIDSAGGAIVTPDSLPARGASSGSDAPRRTSSAQPAAAAAPRAGLMQRLRERVSRAFDSADRQPVAETAQAGPPASDTVALPPLPQATPTTTPSTPSRDTTTPAPTPVIPPVIPPIIPSGR